MSLREPQRDGEPKARPLAFGAQALAAEDERKLRARHARAGVGDDEDEPHAVRVDGLARCTRTRTPPCVV